MRLWTIGILAGLSSLGGCSSDGGTRVRVTLEDGQVMVGDVQTHVLRLDGGMGTVEVPLEDVGEVLPVEGPTVEAANQHVTVWLRNGSELRGRWDAPELAMAIQAGGVGVPVDLPTGELVRFQLQGGGRYETGLQVRVRTVHGDDFYVDPERTTLALENELGVFRPSLAECVSMRPISDDWEGDWRLELETGTVLVGPLQEDHLVFSLEMGPDALDVPLEHLVSLEREFFYDGNQAPAPNAAPKLRQMPMAADEPEEGAGAGWYSSGPASSMKSH